MTEEIPPTEKRLPVIEHLRELRTCLIRSCVALSVSAALSLYFTKDIFRILQKPLLENLSLESTFIATSPLEAMITYLKVGLLAGVFIASPVILHQVWRFIAPALYAREKLLGATFVTVATLLFVGGALFGYFIIFPVGFKFFVSIFVGTDIQFLPQMKDYLGFVTKMLLTFGILFELPLVLVSLSLMGVVSHHQLRSWRRYIIVLAFLVAGVLTPGPDILSQLLMALPLLVLYELSLLTIWLIGKKKV